MKTIWLAILALALPCEQVFAWGQEGHSIVAELAEHRLDQPTLEKIGLLLKIEIPSATHDARVSLGSIASWADDYRAEHDETRNWHFVNIPFERGTYDPQVDCKADPKFGDCIINAIERNRVLLADCTGTPAERAQALKFLVHLIGDIHQPLHDTDRNDHGGNDVVVTFFGKSVKLHAVWDTEIIMHTVFAWGAYVTRLETTWFPGRDVTSLDGGSPTDWALEAHQLARETAYVIPDGGALEMNYYTAAQPVVDRQLAVAGMRLAKFLKDTFKPTTACP
ncbi:S1/P1 nuclease [Bradyrhizobium sp. I1.7.5]|uniref:S1/P1 nuclease n=1 Tax=Bradyrhizobium sp. I1.7.5 TaxID=3156363 RepID=UPI003395CEFE